ncbi:YcxB family protein [Microvirga sp. STR05]|uniref:YcxB family protein n=1 Tax=Hymenobacter duratus TaxID=2771356 RepID=A0ABR8JI89_9BACT|nr:YcxB family protein [Hymenobacter duratus]MBD2715565.1 YcxB family protein [Hymenobacter duratus]MBR7950473.1 YcxB family protein [Microvirga sp. STR05]
MHALIVADVRVSEDEYVAISTRMHQRQRWITLALTVVLLLCMLWSDGGLTDLTSILTTAGLLVLLVALTWWLGRRKFRKQYRSTASLQHPVTYTLSADGITSQSALGQALISWTSIQAIRPLDRWFVVTLSTGVSFPIDSRCVQPPYTATDLATILAQNGATLGSSPAPPERLAIPVTESGISISNVQPTLGQYMWLSLRLTAKTTPIVWVLLLPHGSALVVLWNLLSGTYSLQELWQNNTGQLFMTVLFLALPIFILWATRKQYLTSPLLKHPVTYLLTSDKMLVDSLGCNSEISWVGIQQAVRYGRWIFLQTTQNAGYILDMQQVTSPHTATDVFSLFQDQRITLK